MAYKLELLEKFSEVRNVFHVSHLKKFLRVSEEQLTDDDLKIYKDLANVERSIKIIEVAERITRSKVIMICKVQWSHHMEDEETWVREDELKV